MFDPPTPEEILHTRIRKAAMDGDVQQVRQILAVNPEAAKIVERPNTVLQALCLAMFSFQHKPEHIECMVEIAKAGGDMAKAFNYTDSPITILLRRGIVPALRALQDNGLLADAIMPEKREGSVVACATHGMQSLTFVCTSTQWRDLDRNYPIAEMVGILLEAGALPYEPHDEDDSPAVKRTFAAGQLIWALDGANVYRPPSGCAKAFAMLLEHDPQTIFNEEMVLRAWRSKNDEIFACAARRYFEQGGTHEALQAMAKKTRMKPEQAAKLQSDAFSVMTAEAPVARKPGSRF